MKIKRITAAAAAMLMLAGCGENEGARDSDRLNVAAANFAMYDLASAVCGGLCDVTMIIPPGSDVHDFEATLRDAAAVSEADVFVYLGSEDWAADIFASMGDAADELRIVNALEVVGEKGTDIVSDDGSCIVSAGHSHDHDHDHDHDHALDEHCWLSVGNARAIIGEITEAVASADESLRSRIEEKAEAYISRLETIDNAYFELMNGAQKRKIVVADRFPYAYMTARYGIEYEAAFSGCTSDTEPSLAVINSLIETVKAEDIRVIFVTEDSDRRTAEAVAAETGAEIEVLCSAQTVTEAEFENGATLAYFMEKNLASLKRALGE